MKVVRSSNPVCQLVKDVWKGFNATILNFETEYDSAETGMLELQADNVRRLLNLVRSELL